MRFGENPYLRIFYAVGCSHLISPRKKRLNKTHCVKSVRIRNYSVRMRENANQNNSEYGHFLWSDFPEPVIT